MLNFSFPEEIVSLIMFFIYSLNVGNGDQTSVLFLGRKSKEVTKTDSVLISNVYTISASFFFF